MSRLDLDSYLSWMRRHNNLILHLGCYLTPAGARLAAERLLRLADEIDVPSGTRNLPADIRTGAGGACGRHGVFHGLVCPKCAASEGKP